MTELKVLKLDPGAHPPERANPGDLGYDLFSLNNLLLAPGDTKIVRTGIALEFPAGWGGIIKDRSSMAAKGITISAGVIDNGYRGEIGIVMNNCSGAEFFIEAGQKIAQLIPTPVTDWSVTVAGELGQTERGEGGFGSSGKGKGDLAGS